MTEFAPTAATLSKKLEKKNLRGMKKLFIFAASDFAQALTSCSFVCWVANRQAEQAAS